MMDPINILKSVVPFALAAVMLTGGCNVDGVQTDRRPKGPEANATGPEPHDVAMRPITAGVPNQEEMDLVEAVITYRDRYQQSLNQLRDFYEARGNHIKLQWAEFELKGVRNVKPFRYVMDAEVPPATLRPVDKIDAADAMYNRGLELMRKGGYGMPALYRQEFMVQASVVFRDLIDRYPTSDKIDDAAFFQGEIHKEYFPEQEMIAVKWYERALTWNPNTPHPVRFQAAVVYDYRLHDRDRALELYQDLLKNETANGSNVRFANRRIGQLVRDHTARAASR